MGLRKEGGRGGGGGLLESVVLIPCLALWELTSRSAWRAMLMGSWPSNSLDMVRDVLSLVLGVRNVFVVARRRRWNWRWDCNADDVTHR